MAEPPCSFLFRQKELLKTKLRFNYALIKSLQFLIIVNDFPDFNSYNNRSGGWSGGNQNGGGRFMDQWNNNPGNGGGNSGGGGPGMHCVHMRGLPFKATQLDIADVSLL